MMSNTDKKSNNWFVDLFGRTMTEDESDSEITISTNFLIINFLLTQNLRIN